MNASENPARGEIVIYYGPDGGVTLDVRLEQETLWLSLNQFEQRLKDEELAARQLLQNMQQLPRREKPANRGTRFPISRLVSCRRNGSVEPGNMGA